MTALGILTILLGIVALFAPGITGMSIVAIIGALVLVGGIFRLIWSFRSGSFGKGLIGFALGVLTIIAGIILLSSPVIASAMLTIFLAVYFIVDGVAELFTGFSASPPVSRGWLIIAGIISILLGIMLWAQYPLSGAWALGVLFGIKLIFVGMTMITMGRASKA